MSLGPTLGGTRIFPYKSFDEALTDVLRLSRGMTYKSAIVEGGTGGAKSVIIADPKKDKTPELLKAFGEAVHRMQGNYVCAEDIGCTVDDVAIIRASTKYVVGLKHPKSSGNPSPFTAYGVFRAIQATMQELDGTDSLEGKTIAVQGTGSVGTELLSYLFWAGAKLIISDIDEEKLEGLARKYGAKIVSTHEILYVPCDILAPCALGGIINQNSIPKLNCRAIVGAANNQLHEDEDGNRLAKREILYAPDFLVNAGGLINVISEVAPDGYDATAARAKVGSIYHQVRSIFELAKKNNTTTNEAATTLVEYRLKHGIGKRIEPFHFHHE